MDHEPITGPQRLDSGADPEHAVGAVWRDRFTCGTVLVALSPKQGEKELRLQAKAEAALVALRAKARETYYALTARKRTVSRKAKA